MTREQYAALPEETRFAVWQSFLMTLNVEDVSLFLLHTTECETCQTAMFEQFAEFVLKALVVKNSDLQRMAKASMN